MKKVSRHSISCAPDGSEVVLCEDEDSTTYLAFSEEYSRFVGLKMYGETFPDARARRLLQENAELVRSRFTSGLAFPLEVGDVDGRIY